MSQVVYRGNLSAKSLPLLTDFQGRTIIVPGPDNTFVRSVVSAEDQDRDIGIPYAYYGHNILPASYGFQSVGYESLIPALAPPTIDFTTIFLLRSNALSPTQNGPRYYFSPKTSGLNYTLTLGSAVWQATLTAVPFSSSTVITVATVQGISYIFFSGIGCYKWNSTTNVLTPVTLTGLVPANILGICAFQGYMIAFDSSSIYWSSVLDIDYTTDTVDFTPSLLTGAGSLRLEGAKGPITVVAPATFGIAVYTTANIVSAVYSGNSRYPFNFKEIVNSGGCTSLDLIAYDSNTGDQYAYTTSGVQSLTATSTKTVFPELTDFLAGQVIEDFNETTFVFSKTLLSAPMMKKISSIADRYLIFSYGQNALTHAIVYDMVQKRYGKLRITHVDCFEYEYLDPALADAPRKSIAFLKADGSISVANLNINYAGSSGVLVLGKFQYNRTRLLTLEAIALQNSQTNQSLSVYDLFSVIGSTIDKTTRTAAYDVTAAGEIQKLYKIHTTGLNHSVLLIGGFSLASFVLSFHINGRR